MMSPACSTAPFWPANAVHIVSVSGGKDSTATLLSAVESGVAVRAVFADTGNEHQITYDYLEYLESKTGVKIERVMMDFSEFILKKRLFIAHDRRLDRRKRWSTKAKHRSLNVLYPSGNPFLDLSMWKGRFPSRRAQFCTQWLKRIPIFDGIHFPVIQAGNVVVSWQGIRRDESVVRSVYSPIEWTDDLITYRPILNWTADDAFRLSKRHGIKPNPLYLMGMLRVGCMPCINSSKEEIYEISRRFPEVIDRIRKWEGQVGLASKRNISTFFHRSTIGISAKHANIDAVVGWSKTIRGGRQFSLVKTIPAPVCLSHYGLCE